MQNYNIYIILAILKSHPCSQSKTVTMGSWLQFAFVFIGKKQGEKLEEGVNAKISNGGSLPWQEQAHM